MQTAGKDHRQWQIMRDKRPVERLAGPALDALNKGIQQQTPRASIASRAFYQIHPRLDPDRLQVRCAELTAEVRLFLAVELQHVQRYFCQHFAYVVDSWIHKQPYHCQERWHSPGQLYSLLHADMTRAFLIEHEAERIRAIVSDSRYVLLAGNAANLYACSGGHPGDSINREVALYLEAGPTSCRR